MSKITEITVVSKSGESEVFRAEPTMYSAHVAEAGVLAVSIHFGEVTSSTYFAPGEWKRADVETFDEGPA